VRRQPLVFLAALLPALAAPLAAQRPDSLVASGIRAYRDLDFDAAAGLLVRATALLAERPDTALQVQALMYLGAVEIYRGRPDSGQAVFRGLVRLTPGYRVDRLVFPPEVTSVFDAARRTTAVVGVGVPREVEFPAGSEGFTVRLVGSTFHQIQADVRRPDGSVVRSLYAGPIGDSLTVGWDGRTGQGLPPVTGRYWLVVSSLDSAGGMGRVTRVPLDVVTRGVDTLPVPLLPQQDLLPEQRPGRGSWVSLAGGLLLGAATAAVPALVAPDASLSGGQYAVGVALAVAGVVGFVLGRDEQPIPENIAANDSTRAVWQAGVASAAAENERRRATAGVYVRTGAAQVIDPEGS
jgi:hypothetical protein